jgi:hypothetical protein
VKNTAYFDIAAYPFHQRVPGIAESAAGWRLFAQDATDKPARSSGRDAGEGTARVGEHANEPGEDSQVGAVTGWPGVTRPSEVDE